MCQYQYTIPSRKRQDGKQVCGKPWVYKERVRYDSDLFYLARAAFRSNKEKS